MIPGWYGKLPTLGDFASRRLDADFIEPWDLWLGEGLAAHREQLGEAWLDSYLKSPVWRFVLMPGVTSTTQTQAVAGVLMPSVDRVGRYFPLTLAMPLTRLPFDAAGIERLLGWLHTLEDVAIDALHDDWTVEQLEDVLAGLPAFEDTNAVAETPLDATRRSLEQTIASGGGFVDIGAIASRSQLAGLLVGGAGASVVAALPSLAGSAFWLADVPGEGRLLVSRGLPAREQFVQTLGATGREPGQVTVF